MHLYFAFYLFVCVSVIMQELKLILRRQNNAETARIRQGSADFIYLYKALSVIHIPIVCSLYI